jgi:FtsX-like permease family
VIRQAFRVAGYRLRATLPRRWPGYLALVLLVGLVGGLSMGSIAAARRTQSSYPTFLASTNPSDLFFSSFGTGGPAGAQNGPHSLTDAKVAHLAHVKSVDSDVNLLAAPLGRNGAPELAKVARLDGGGSIDGLGYAQDRLSVVQGRMANPRNSREFVTTAEGARLLGLRVGQHMRFGVYSVAQLSSPRFGTAAVAPKVNFEATLAGIVVVNDEVVQDDIDGFETEVFFSPALTRRALADSTGIAFGLRLSAGDRDVPKVERELTKLVPPGSVYEFHRTSLIEARVERVVKPESIALGTFGAIAAVAALVIAGLAISRQLQAGEADREVLRALGAAPVVTAADGLVGVVGAVWLGSLLAVGVAIALSPLAPIGPVRPVYRTRGFVVDWTVVGFGTLILIVGLTAIAGVLSYRTVPHRVVQRSRLGGPTHGSRLARAATAVGLPAPGVVGVRFALEPGRRSAAPVRSALVGATLAVVTVAATVTFGSGLHTLVSRPALYGWNWNYVLYPGNQNVPQRTLNQLHHDPDVAAATGVSPEQAQIDGQEVPVLIGALSPDPAPPILSGKPVTKANQIVLGGATLHQLHKHIGDTVTLSYGVPQDAPIYVPPTRLRIVGTATFPAIGYPSDVADHTSMGTGGLVSTDVEPRALRRAENAPDPLLNGPSMVLVRLRPGITEAAGLANMRQVVKTTNAILAADQNAGGDSISVLGVQRPAEIVNYQSMGITPEILAAGLAAGAVIALGLTLAQTVRRRRRDLALLKALGFTRRQLSATVAWQASVAAVVGVVLGLPIGIALGRLLWTLFARDINAVPEPTVPVLAVVLVAVGTILLANIVAAVPGRIAAHTPITDNLRAD